MSWMKRPQGGAPPPAAEQTQYGPPQPYGSQHNMYPTYQGTPLSITQQQQYWQMQQQQHARPQYNQQYEQMYQHQNYAINANQYYQQPTQYNQNYPNPNYNNTQQAYTNQQNYYPHQGGPQQNYSHSKMNNDGWEDNWDWGWEDSTKQKPVSNQINPQSSTSQSQVCNNANVIEESFTSTNTWNWAMDDKKDLQEQSSSSVQENKESSQQGSISKEGNLSSSPPEHCSSDQVKTLHDKDTIKERLPNLALGKRFNLENLTPQWSIESQMSQESSDGPQTRSEGTYRSENQSRNSSKSSPDLNMDNSNFNYSQTCIDEIYPQSTECSNRSNEDSTKIDSHKNSSIRRESHDELSSSLQDMNISNTENFVSGCHKVNAEFDHNLEDSLPPPYQPPPSTTLSETAQPGSDIPDASVSPSMPPPPPISTTTNLPSTGSVLPPTSFTASCSSLNPFKHAGLFSHKSISKNVSNAPSQPFSSQMGNSNLTSPAVVNKISQNNRMPVGFGANLETTPDNSERPDQPQAASFRSVPVSPEIPENMEVAPQHDRNEYLQTEHLSSVDFNENTDFSQNVPPPGLRRMVVGQHETEYSQNLNISGDEPPPGLARMVPGQQTESDGYNQSNDTYMVRHVDGQMTDNSDRPFRQADGQQTPDNYSQPPPDRRPIGLDRMVPGEPSNNEYMQYPGGNYGSSNEPRVVTGVDHNYPLHVEPGPTDVREQNVDGSDYTEPAVRNPTRNIIGSRDATNDSSVDFAAAPGDQQQEREVTMEGENLQDLSIISGADMTFSREQMFDVVSANTTEMDKDRNDSVEYPANSSRRQSVNRVNTSGEDSDRDRTFRSSPRRDRQKQKSSRDRERDRERNKDGRYSRGDRTNDRDPDRRIGRDGRRSEKERTDRDQERKRRDRDISPESHRHRRSTRSRKYETQEDTDYYSDRERERRRYREGSYTSKPPRPDDQERRHEERKRYSTADRDRYNDDGGGGRRRGDRHRDRRYRDIDPANKYGNLRRDHEDRKRGETYSSPSRAGSREATATDEEAPGPERRRGRRPRTDRDRDSESYYLGGYGGSYGDPFLLQRQQYSYYERLRRADPAAYMRIYKQLLAAPHNLYAEGYGPLGYEARAEERGSVHSGRSSAAGLKPNDTYCGCRAEGGSLRDAPSLRTDLSDRDLNTDASLNLQLEESTVRSERMTPFKFSTAHIKGTLSARHVVVVQAAYPVDGRPATVQLVPLAAAVRHLPGHADLLAYPGPLLRGVTHKKSVIEYCRARAGDADRSARDPLGQMLLWELLALLLRQNGVVVGTDIAELLMKNTSEHALAPAGAPCPPRPGSPRDSSASGAGHEDERVASATSTAASAAAPHTLSLAEESAAPPETAVLDRLREYLIYGNRQEALEWAMNNNLWGHALQLAAYSERRVRAGVAARFLAAVPHADPLHTLYATLAARMPPAATFAAEERWGDWRPHAAIMLANGGARPDHERRALTQLGDSLASRGLVFSAQFCYLSAGVPFAQHPLAPLRPRAADGAAATPRLSLLLADPRAATLPHLATDRAIFATEIYEYALSLSHEDYVIEDFQVYKLVAACRLADAGQCERALAYAESAARAVMRAPRRYPPALPAALARLADRLKYYEGALHVEPPPVMEEAEPGADSAEPSPRHHLHWIDDVRRLADLLEAESREHGAARPQPPAGHDHDEPAFTTIQYQQPSQTYPDTSVVAQHYQPQSGLHELVYSQQDAQPALHDPLPEEPPGALSAPTAPAADTTCTYGEEWPPADDQVRTYADPYWLNDQHYGYGEAVTGAADGEVEPRPTITMPGAAPSRPSPYARYDDDAPPDARSTPQSEPEGGKPESKGGEDGGKADGKGKGGWFGGILTKLSLRPPNQMILPDDKNPTIVWDAEHKRWRNLEADGEETPRAPPPPPQAPRAVPPATAQTGVAAAAGAPPVANIFKMQKGRHIKKSYVDVFNPSGAATRPLPPAAEVLGAPPPAASAMHNYFVPAPLPAQGYYEPGRAGEEELRGGL